MSRLHAGALGGMLGAVFATTVAGLTIWGIEGWRFAFRTVGISAVMIGFVSLVFIKDPRVDNQACSGGSLSHGLRQGHGTGKVLKEIFTVRLLLAPASR